MVSIFAPIRTWLRDAYLRTLRKALSHEEGKSACVAALGGVLPPRLAAVRAAAGEFALPYDDLPSAPTEPSTRGQDMVFVTGRFRSGTTLLWNLFRRHPECTAYYEPFNERRWFDERLRGERVDPTHVGVDDYWREYAGLEELGRYYDEDWTRRDLFMDGSSWNPSMRRFIEVLAARAPNRPVLKFNRLDFRLPWIRHNFPRAKIVHVFRHPRDQWCSTLLRKPQFPPTGSVKNFEDSDEFYLLTWARDLRYHFPFLDPNEVEHPYELYYYIWMLSYRVGKTFADVSVRFEDLVDDPHERVEELLTALDMSTADVAGLCSHFVKPTQGRWRQYADADWFAKREARCNAVMHEFFGSRSPGLLPHVDSNLAAAIS